MTPSCDAQFVGEDRIDHTPKNETVRLKLGDSFDVTARKKQTDFRKPMPGDWEIVSESHPHKKEAAGTAVWELPVPADGSATLTYRVRVRY